MNKTELGMVCDHVRLDEKMVVEAARRKGVRLNVHDADELCLRIGAPGGFEPVVLQRSVSYFRNLHATALLEAMGVRVVNSFRAALTCGNKALASMALSKAGVPTPKTYLAFSPEGAMKALGELGYPAVLKPVVGSWGRLIAPLKDPESAKAILESRKYMFPIYQIYYVQEMVDKPGRDVRCFVVGDRAVAAIYRYSPPGEFKTNVYLGGRAEECEVTGELEDLSVRAARAVGGEGVFGVDLMEGPEGLLVHEVNYATEFKATVETTGADIPGLIIDYLIELAKR